MTKVNKKPGQNILSRIVKGTFLSLLLGSAVTACTNEVDGISVPNNQLQLKFGVNNPTSRAIFTESTLPNAKPVGVKLDGYNYTGLTYTGTTASGKQTWSPNQDVVLTETSGTLYAYWPYSESIDMTAIPVDMTAEDQTDWLYATPVENVNEDNPSHAVTMNHALANINLTINRGSYVGDGNISSITVQSDAFATKGTFNAAQPEPVFTSFADTEGQQLTRTITATLGSTTDIMVVPTATEANIDFVINVDGVNYTAQAKPVQLVNGNSYLYTLTLNSTFLGVSAFSVTPWGTQQKDDDLILEKEDADGGNTGSGPAIDATGKANGVYVVTATGQLVDKSAATADCIGVAFISDNQKVMIAKTDATDGTNTTLYWGYNLYQKDVDGLDNLADATAAKADFNGQDNTAKIIAGYTAHGVEMNSRDMCKVLETYNEGGYTDWYVPAAGQLNEIYTNVTDINTTLINIGGNRFKAGGYLPSSEKDAERSWWVDFAGDGVINSSKNSTAYVRFVRDIN